VHFTHFTSGHEVQVNTHVKHWSTLPAEHTYYATLQPGTGTRSTLQLSKLLTHDNDDHDVSSGFIKEISFCLWACMHVTYVVWTW